VTGTTYLTTPAAASYTVVRLSGSASAFDLQVSVKFGLCPPAFWETTLCADWNWSFCETPLSACLSFGDEEGFQSLTLTARDLRLFENVFGVAASLDVRLEYTTTEKSVTPTIRFEPDWLICPEIALLGEAVLSSPETGISAIRAYGATVELPIGNVVFRVADSFVDEKNAAVTGKAAYFEVFRIEAPIESCCGSPGRVEGSVYFERSPAPSGGLFGVGLLEGKAEVRMTSHLLLGLTIEVRPTSPNWIITARLRALW
jgi:hypothetical protein